MEKGFLTSFDKETGGVLLRVFERSFPGDFLLFWLKVLDLFFQADLSQPFIQVFSRSDGFILKRVFG